MAFLDELKKITRPYDEDDDFYMEDEEKEDYSDYSEKDHDAEEEFDEPAPTKSVFSKRDREREAARSAASAGDRKKMKLILSNPVAFEEAAEIADNLREKRAVLMNLEKATKDVQRRLIDFLSGVAYALGGKVKRVSAQTYIITPTNVDLVGDAIDDFESSGLYF